MKVISEKPAPKKSTRFSYLIGRIRVMEKGLVNSRVLESALRSDDFEQARRVISELPGLGEMIQNIEKEPDAIDRSLVTNFWDTVKGIGSHKAGRNIARFFSLPFDFANAKLAVKRNYLSSQAQVREYPGEIPREKFSGFIGGESREFLPEAFRHGLEEAWMGYENTRDPQHIELVLDRYALEEALSLGRTYESAVLRNWVIAYVIFAFIRAALRARFQERSVETLGHLYFKNPYIRMADLEELISGSEENVRESISKLGFADLIPASEGFQNNPAHLAELEKAMDDYLMRFIRRYRTSAFGPEPVFGFLYARLTDTRNLRIILLGKYFGLAEEDLRAKTRECYHE